MKKSVFQAGFAAVFLFFAAMTAPADEVFDQLDAAGGNARAAAEILSANTAARSFIAAGQTDSETRQAADLLTGAPFASILNAQMQRTDILHQTLMDQLSTPGLERSWLTIWGAGYGGTGDVGTDTYSGYDYDLYGGVLGLEFSGIACANFGVFYSLGKSSLDAGSIFGSTAVDTEDNIIGAYAKWHSLILGGYTLLLGNYTFSDYDTERVILDEIHGGRYTGTFDGTQWGVYVEKGWNATPSSCLWVNQFFAVQYQEISTDGFSENGPDAGLLGLRHADMEYDSLRLYVGARTRLTLSCLQFSLNLTYIYEFMDEYPTGLTGFADGSDSVMITGRGLGDDWLNVGAGAKISLGGCISLMANYNCNWGDSTIHTGMATLRFDF